MSLRHLAAEAEQQRKGQSLWVRAWKRLLKKKVGMASLAVIAILYLSGIFANWVAPYSYSEQNLRAVRMPPTLAHPLGTDRLGRDEMSRIIWSLRTTVIITITSILTGALLLGIFLGLASGYLGGKVDAIVMRIGEIFLAFPDILLVILLVATLKPRVLDWVRAFEDSTGIKGIVQSGAVDYLVVFGALAAFSWVGMARLVRGQVFALKEGQFIEAARAMGASTWRIIWVHLLPNVLSPVLVVVSMGMGSVAGSEVFLSWLGIGIQPPMPSLGNMIWENQSIGVLRQDPHLLLAPALTIGVIIFAFNLLGDALNDALNPKAR